MKPPDVQVKVAPLVSVGVNSLQAALEMFGADQEARPHRATCKVCDAYHVAAASKTTARNMVLSHIGQDHQLIEAWTAGEL